MTDDANAVVVETDIAAAPETVWRVLSEPELAGAWLGPGKVSAEPGDRFSLDDDGRRIDCEVLEAEPARRLRLGWRDSDGGVASEVSFVLTPTPAGGTHLRVTHGRVVVTRLASARSRAVSRRSRPASMSAAPFRMAA